MNNCILHGRLTRDVDCKYFGETAISQITIAVDGGINKKTGEKLTDFITCKAFNKTAETISNYFAKGNEIIVQGAFKTDKWEKDGQKHSRSYILVNRVEFCGSKKYEQEISDEEIPF